MTTPKLDEIGYWSEVKLDIIKEYAQAYSKILTAQRRPKLKYIYIDGFAGSGIHKSKKTKEFTLGSPLNALWVNPPFKEYHLVDLDTGKATMLRELTKEYPTVSVYEGDCNQILLNSIFPKARFEDYARGLCVLDPYGLHLDWEVVKTAGTMKSIDIFLNFPIMDMNMNVLWHDTSAVSKTQINRMNAFWGDGTWKDAAYTTEQDLFGDIERKSDNIAIVEAYKKRLKSVAGFKYVQEPMPMRNTKGAVVYYLFFATHKPVAADILAYIFNKHRNRTYK